jgi:UDP-glucose 4-epimerase
MRGYFVVGGAGFIGSHLVDRLMADENTAALTVYDNFSSGRDWHVAGHRDDRRFTLVRADVEELPRLATAMTGHDTVIHLAGRPEPAFAARHNPADFGACIALTQNILNAMRSSGATLLLYASAGDVYGEPGGGETGRSLVQEHASPTIPRNSAAAGRVASEALISAYAHSYGMIGRAFRLTEVVGARQTNGIAYELVRRILARPGELSFQGHGSRIAAFVHVDDVADAMLRVARRVWSGADPAPFRAYNVAAADQMTIRDMAALAAELCGSLAPAPRIATEPERHQPGLAPELQLDTDQLKATGWTCTYSSRAAVQAAIVSLMDEAKAGLLEAIR